MPIHLHFNEKLEIIELGYSGIITNDELIQSVKDAGLMATEKKSFRVITDCQVCPEDILFLTCLK